MTITRFAPSPTGNLHIGGLRTAIFNYLHARAHNGKFLLRIEDTDFKRNSINAKEGILQAFEWVGLEYDGEVIYQSQRMDIYKQYIQKLLDSKQAYYCYMSKEELEQLREEQRHRGEKPHYDKRYRDFMGTPPNNITPSIRIKAPLDGKIVFNDKIKGTITIDAQELDDFIIARSDGTPTYNFTVAIDDALMNITDIIRGDDHLSNTPKQIIIYNALGFKIPEFCHIPMIHNDKGKKLSKREGAMGVMDYKEQGYLPEAVLNFLVRLGWSHGDDEIFSLSELIKYFNCNDINKSASIFNPSKLLWLNHHYINQKSNEEILALLETNTLNITPNIQENLFDALKERSKTLVEFEKNLQEILNAPQEYDIKLLKTDSTSKIIELLEHCLSILQEISFDISSQDLHEIFSEKIATYIKPNKALLPLRLGLLGKGGGVPIFNAMLALGKEESLRRLEYFKLFMQNPSNKNS